MTKQSRAGFPCGVAVVIGGSGGVGRAICAALAVEGTDVALTYRANHAAASDAARLVEQLGRRTQVERLSLEDRDGVANAFKSIRERMGPIHTVVNAAGTSISLRYVSQIPASEWDAVMRSDVDGFFNVVQASLPHLRESRGSYVNITTAGLLRWPAKDVLSVVPKAAIHALITGVAREEGRNGVRANSVALGLIDAGLFLRLKGQGFDEKYVAASLANMALKRLGTADEVADAVAFLASDRARYITGQMLALDGGFSL